MYGRFCPVQRHIMTNPKKSFRSSLTYAKHLLRQLIGGQKQKVVLNDLFLNDRHREIRQTFRVGRKNVDSNFAFLMSLLV